MNRIIASIKTALQEVVGINIQCVVVEHDACKSSRGIGTTIITQKSIKNEGFIKKG